MKQYPATFLLVIACLLKLSAQSVTSDEKLTKSAQAETLEEQRAKAELGDAISQLVIGDCYRLGWGVTQNDIEAVKWYRKVAEMGVMDAQANLGIAYANGQGVVKNELIAYQWFLLASARGLETSRENVSILEKRLTAELRAEGQRLATEWQAAFEKRHKEHYKNLIEKLSGE